MAADRTPWADDRTLIGWIRTSLSLIGFGFGINAGMSFIDRIAFRSRGEHHKGRASWCVSNV
ncbi:DUF202 domain-containing protein [Desulfoferrobacter suflitae]|uniref:DUF202 domain-containing protein n=1 Tax=Desulfoferrobacter suflitae TaxID=2865782 RepID=UPI00338E0F00